MRRIALFFALMVSFVMIPAAVTPASAADEPPAPVTIQPMGFCQAFPWLPGCNW